MVQTSNEQSRKAHEEIRRNLSSIPYYESDIPQSEQQYNGWYYCSERKAYYRWSEFIDYKC